mgnify:CR=1 FL=1
MNRSATSAAAAFVAAAVGTATLLYRRAADARLVAALQARIATYLNDPLPTRNNASLHVSHRRRPTTPPTRRVRARVLSATGSGLSANVPRSSKWFGPEVDLGELASRINETTFPTVRHRPRAWVVNEVLRQGFEGNLSARRERASELLVSLRMRGILSEKDLVDGVRTFLASLTPRQHCTKRVVKLLCHVVAAEVVSEDTIVAMLPTRTRALVDEALRGGMRVLSQRRGVRAAVNSYVRAPAPAFRAAVPFPVS